MNKEQIQTILMAWYYQHNGDTIKDAFEYVGSPIGNLEDAFILLCEELFGKDFMDNWEPENG